MGKRCWMLVDQAHVIIETAEQDTLNKTNQFNEFLWCWWFDHNYLIRRIVEGRMLRFRSSVFKDDPIIMQTIKQEKTNPNGQAFADCEESRMGVHKKTKIYMIDSNMDWTNPKSMIVWSLYIVRKPSTNERPRPNWRLPILKLAISESPSDNLRKFTVIFWPTKRN